MTRSLHISCLMLCLVAFAGAKDLKQCTLSSARSGKLHGPFVLQDGFEIELDTERFTVKLAAGGQVQFVAVDGKNMFGPYDVELGRMIRLGEQLYTLVDIETAPYQAPITRATPAPVAAPVMRPPDTTPVAPPILAPVTPKPPPSRPAPRPVVAPAAKPAPVPVRTVAPVRPPVVSPKAVVPPRRTPAPAVRAETASGAVQPARPPTWMAQKPAPVPYRPQSTPPPATVQPSRRTIPWERERQPRERRDSLADRPLVALDVSFYEAVSYDREIRGTGVSSESSVSRNAVGLTLRWLPVTVRAGLVLRAAWDEKLPGDGAAFQSVDLDGGNGWWGEIGLQYPVWTQGPWQLDVRGVGGVRQETYDLTYGAWQQTEVTTPLTGTNLTEDTVVLIRELANTTQSASFSETLFELGLTLSHGTETWCAFASADLIAYQDAELDSVIEVGGASYTIALERSQPFIVSLGGCVRRNNVNWFGELSLIGETAFRIGSSYTF